MNRENSRRLFAEALGLMPGGVNSPVRAFRAVGGQPFFVKRAFGARLVDVDDHEYIDYVCTWGPNILGHAHPSILRAVSERLKDGLSFGTCHPLEIEMAKLIRSLVPSIEKLRMCNSGTEAAMSCVRLARGFTGRERIIKFEGCYHGHGDSLLVKAGSGALTFGQPDSAGVPAALAALTISLPFNDPEAVRAAFREHGKDLAAVILEPIPANAGLYLPGPGWLEFLREITAAHGTLLIFDEVMSGFRVAPGGAQQVYGIRPDLTALGKVIGGGLPVGAFGGRAEIMDHLAPLGPVYQAGTLSGNPIALAAGLANLRELTSPSAGTPDPYAHMEKLGAALEVGLRDAARRAKRPCCVQRAGSMFCAYFRDGPVRNLAEAKLSDTAAFGKYFSSMLDHGISLAPSQFEAGFLCAAHTVSDIETTIRAASEALRTI
ncbi:MAG: glutamate-1-semialdehyde 2,1-aminomutase [Verrucomicrobiia bacterium]